MNAFFKTIRCMLFIAAISPVLCAADVSPLPNIVRIIAFDGGGQSFGSGSYIGTYQNYGIIITNRHVIADSEGLIHVHFPGGFSSFGAVIKNDSKWDLALLAVSKPPENIPLLPIASRAIAPNDPIWIAGYGGGTYRLAAGHCTRYLTPDNPAGLNGQPALYEIIEVTAAARQGDSGGPILNAQGELAGVLFGSDMIQYTAGSYSGRVAAFLASTTQDMRRLPERPETLFASVETDGPKYLLRYSHSLMPAASSPQSGTKKPRVPVSQIKGIVIPVSEGDRNKTNGNFTLATPVLSEKQAVLPVAYAEPAARVARKVTDSGEDRKSPATAADGYQLSSIPRLYGIKLFADKNDRWGTPLVLFNIFAGIVLFATAVRLLKQ